MFIYSLRASTLKFFGIVFAGVAALVAILIIFPAVRLCLPPRRAHKA